MWFKLFFFIVVTPSSWTLRTHRLFFKDPLVEFGLDVLFKILDNPIRIPAYNLVLFQIANWNLDARGHPHSLRISFCRNMIFW